MLQPARSMRLHFLVPLLLFAPCLLAQTVGTVNGTVTSESGHVMELVLVTLDPAGASRQLRTDRDGRFSFVGVSPGAHTVRVTWVGYAPEERTVEITSGIVTLDFTLHRLTRLDTVVVAGKRTGLYGVVLSRDSLQPVPGARIEVIGSRKSDSTDANGVFSMPEVKPGAYLVRVRHPMFESRNVPAVVPVGGSVSLDIIVTPGLVSRDQHMEMLYREMDSRLSAKGQHAIMVTREELRGREKMMLDAALQTLPRYAAKTILLPSNACLFVDGVPRPGVPVQAFAVEDIEAIEVYAATQEEAIRNPSAGMRRAEPTGSLLSRWPPRAECGTPPPPSENIPRSRVRALFVAIWLRR